MKRPGDDYRENDMENSAAYSVLGEVLSKRFSEVISRVSACFKLSYTS